MEHYRIKVHVFYLRYRLHTSEKISATETETETCKCSSSVSPLPLGCLSYLGNVFSFCEDCNQITQLHCWKQILLNVKISGLFALLQFSKSCIIDLHFSTLLDGAQVNPELTCWPSKIPFLHTDFPLNPLFALDIFICSFRKCIQHTTRGQSKFPLSKLWCCYIFIVLKCWW